MHHKKSSSLHLKLNHSNLAKAKHTAGHRANTNLTRRSLRVERLETRLPLAAELPFVGSSIKDPQWDIQSVRDAQPEQALVAHTAESAQSSSKDEPLAKLIGPHLFAVLEEVGASFGPLPADGVRREVAIADDPGLVFRDSGKIGIEIIAETDVGLLRSDLEAIGFEESGSFGKLVAGAIDPLDLDKLADLSHIRFVRPVFEPVANIGSVDNEADIAMRSNLAKASFGLDGAGLKIGVLSDSFDRAPSNKDGGGAVVGIASGDLPGPGNPNGFTTPVQVLDDDTYSPPSRPTDEGRAMLELIHDIVPAARLSFHTSSPDTVNFAQGILDLAAAGADVIVDDISYPTQPFFQDGIVAQAAATVSSQGIPFFSSAGNQGRVSYESNWRSNGVQGSINGKGPYIAHDFDPGPAVDNFQLVALAPGGSARIVFQWDQPFASAGGKATANDLDIFVFDFQTGFLITKSDTSNVGGDAFEILSLQNPSAQPLFMNILIGQFLPPGGPTPGKLKYLSFSPSFDIGEFDTRSSTIYGHHQAPGGAGIGAASYLKTPAFGVSPPEPQSTTSAGGLPILFDTAGNRLGTPEVRQQPVVTAPDNTNTTFFIPGNDPDNDGNPNFSGTSAAAPHAASVAALMLQSAGGPGSLTPQQIYNAMQQTAIEMNGPGFDFETGFGFINAEAAIARVRSTQQTVGRNIGEVGRTQVNDSWKTVQFERSYVDPIVVASPASFSGSAPVTVRIRNVKSGSFQVRLQEWDYLDGNHGNEKVSYLVVERGTYQFPDGTRVHADKKLVNHNLKKINFPNVFETAPVVHSQSQTVNGSAAIVTRQRDIGKKSFRVRLQEEQNADGTHSNEQVGYIALERGNGTVGNSAYRIVRAGNVTSNFRTINLGSAFSSAPAFLASMQSLNAIDPAELRYRNLDRNSVDVFVQEEKSKDNETNHGNEVLGYSAFAVGATLVGQPIQAIGETGRITVTDSWKTIQLQNSYSKPIVVASPASFSGSAPVTVRIRNVKSGSFQVRLQEWDYLDGNHGNEKVSYLVVERGTYQFPDGTRVHADKKLVNHNLKKINFPNVFETAPVVHSQSQTVNGSAAIVTRQRDIGKKSFRVRLQEEQNADGTHSNEQVGYVALERGNGTVGDSAYRIVRAGNVTSNFRTINLGSAFSSAPAFLASMQSLNAIDPAELRYRNLDRNSVDVFVQEEKSKDNETNHGNEVLGYSAFAVGATLVGQPIQAIGETGRITVTDSWKTIQLQNSYSKPIVVASPASFSGSAPVTVRIRNVKSGSFQVRLQEWDYLDGNHGNEKVSYLVVERGTYQFPDGTRVHADKKLVNHNLKKINFPNVFETAPVVHSQSQTVNGSAAIVTRQRDIGKKSFRVRLQEEQNADGTHSNEQVGYIALERGNGTVGDSAYRIVRAGNVTSNFRTINLGSAFSSAPAFLASMQSLNAIDPAELRYRNLDRNSVDVFVQEEKSKDNETNHGNEVLGYSAFAQGLLIARSVAGQPGSSPQSLAAVEQFVAEDVNRDGFVSPIDVLMIVNWLAPNKQPVSSFANAEVSRVPVLLDVNGDSVITPLDALLVINHLEKSPERTISSEEPEAIDDTIALLAEEQQTLAGAFEPMT